MTSIDYVTTKLDSLLSAPKQNRMPCLFVFSEKLDTCNESVDKWLRSKIGHEKGLFENTEVDGSGIVMFEMPNRGGSSYIFESIARSIGIKFSKKRGDCAKAQIELFFKGIGRDRIRMIIVKNADNILEIRNKNNRIIALTAIKEFHSAYACPVVFTGTFSGILGVGMTEQFSNSYLSDIVGL